MMHTDLLPRSVRRPLAPTAIALFGAAGLVLALPGCGEDAGDAAIRHAEARFDAVGGGTGPAVDSEIADKIYAEVTNSLGKVAGGSSGVGDAAAVLLSAANLGTAAALTDAALEADQSLRALASKASTELTQWAALNAEVQAAAAIDTRAEADEISRTLRSKQTERERFEAENAAIQARLADLQAQIDDLTARAATARDRAAGAELDMNRQPTATAAAAIAPRVREALLEADGLLTEAERVRAAWNTLRPAAREAELNVGMIQTQMDLLVRSRDEAVARQRAAEADAETARTAAAPVGRRIAELSAELDEERAGPFDAAFDTALRELRGALESARKATGPARTSAQAAAAVAQQGIAELQRRRADTLATLARLFDAMHDARVPGGDHTDRAAQARAASESAHEASSAAFAAAASAYRSMGVQGESRQRLQETADLLDRYAAAPVGQVPDLSTPPPAEETSADDAGDASWTADTGSADETPAEPASEEDAQP